MIKSILRAWKRIRRKRKIDKMLKMLSKAARLEAEKEAILGRAIALNDALNEAMAKTTLKP